MLLCGGKKIERFKYNICILNAIIYEASIKMNIFSKTNFPDMVLPKDGEDLALKQVMVTSAVLPIDHEFGGQYGAAQLDRFMLMRKIDGGVDTYPCPSIEFDETYKILEELQPGNPDADHIFRIFGPEVTVQQAKKVMPNRVIGFSKEEGFFETEQGLEDLYIGDAIVTNATYDETINPVWPIPAAQFNNSFRFPLNANIYCTANMPEILDGVQGYALPAAGNPVAACLVPEDTVLTTPWGQRLFAQGGFHYHQAMVDNPDDNYPNFEFEQFYSIISRIDSDQSSDNPAVNYLRHYWGEQGHGDIEIVIAEKTKPSIFLGSAIVPDEEYGYWLSEEGLTSLKTGDVVLASPVLTDVAWRIFPNIFNKKYDGFVQGEMPVELMPEG